MNYSENQKTVESQYSIKAIIKWLCFFKAISIFSNLLLFTINNCYVSCLMYHQNHNLSKRIIFLVQNVLFSTPLSPPNDQASKKCVFSFSVLLRVRAIPETILNMKYLQAKVWENLGRSLQSGISVYLSIHT